MQGSDDGHIGPEGAVIADGDFVIILDGKIEIHEAAFADGGVAAVVEADGSKHKGTLTECSHKGFEDLLPFGIVFKEGVEFLAQTMGLALFLHKFRHFGCEKTACENSLFFCHSLWFLSAYS